MDSLGRDALKLWPGLAAQIGLDPSDWTAQVIARRADTRVEMVVLRLDGPEAPLALKWQKRPVDPHGFAEAAQAQVEAAGGFPDGVPSLHAVDLEAQAVLMDFVDGIPLSVAMEGAASLMNLQLAGHWLDRFHRCSLANSRVFQPKYTLNFLSSIVAEVRSERRPVLEKERFLACAEVLVAQQPQFEGCSTQAAVPHGDLHMRNLLVGATVKGIDFRGGKAVPVGHDIGRLLADIAIMRSDHALVRPGGVLPDPMLNAFFNGYRLVGPDDPSVRLLMRHRFLAEWWGLPADPEILSPAQRRRWRGIKSLRLRVFPNS